MGQNEVDKQMKKDLSSVRENFPKKQGKWSWALSVTDEGIKPMEALCRQEPPLGNKYTLWLKMCQKHVESKSPV